MEKLEKVIKGLECCSKINEKGCDECPYTSECDEDFGISHLAYDALEEIVAPTPWCATVREEFAEFQPVCPACGHEWDKGHVFYFCRHCGRWGFWKGDKFVVCEPYNKEHFIKITANRRFEWNSET